ncbi:MAG TPA: hypothetical protein DDW51_03915, partial [Cyanobacteria bacterium UBA11367]|nr:hypothetical protein [Cyanobacteria bacterium UBA11367]
LAKKSGGEGREHNTCSYPYFQIVSIMPKNRLNFQGRLMCYKLDGVMVLSIVVAPPGIGQKKKKLMRLN